MRAILNIPKLVEEVIGRLKSYEEANESVMKVCPAQATYFHQRLQKKIREHCGLQIEPSMRDEYTRVYNASQQDESDLGD